MASYQTISTDLSRVSVRVLQFWRVYCVHQDLEASFRQSALGSTKFDSNALCNVLLVLVVYKGGILNH